MKIRYKHQRFQAEATKCVSDVFQGQPKHDGSRTFLNKFGALSFDGFGNLPLVLDNESICENVRGIQMAEGLKPVEHLEGDGRTFTIEMETGTGKTEGTEKALPSFLRENICTCLTILLVLCRYFSILCATNPDCHVITATRFYT